MAFQTDYSQINAADDPITDFTSNNWTPELNDSAANTPIYIEDSSCAWWPWSKGTTGGYAYCTASGSVAGRLAVVWLNMAYADIVNIPVTQARFRLCSTNWTTNYMEWDMLAQIATPLNTPISGHTPIMAYPTNADGSNGTFNTASLSHAGMIGNTGESADGKQGGFDMIFLIGEIGYHSQTMTETFYSSLATECKPTAIPGTANRPLGIYAKTGDSSYTSNVNFVLCDGTSDTASMVTTETGKSISFVNVEPEQEISYIFNNPSGAYTLSYTRTDCSYTWNSQPSTAHIFTDPGNCDTFKVTGCSFKNGGQIDSPADSANRWIRSSKFDDCQAGTISDGEFTDNIVSNGQIITVSADADLTGTQFLTPAVAADASGLVWNGNFDPDGNLDNMTFSKGTNAHHAIEFGISTPTSMTVRNVDFSGFSATDAQNDSTLHIKRTSGTVTINLIGCTGNISYKSAGATVSLVVSPVTTLVHVDDNTGTSLQNARVYMEAADGTGPLPFQDSVTITRSGTTATVTHTAHGMNSNEYVNIDGITDKTEDNNGAKQITVTGANSYTYTTTDSGSTSYTGSIVATGALLYGLTDVNGDISISRTFGSDQPVAGNVRKSSAEPHFKTFQLDGNTIDSTNGLSLNVRMILD